MESKTETYNIRVKETKKTKRMTKRETNQDRERQIERVRETERERFPNLIGACSLGLPSLHLSA